MLRRFQFFQFITARSELRNVLFLAPSVRVFLFVFKLCMKYLGNR